jgi:cytidylate kinase
MSPISSIDARFQPVFSALRAAQLQEQQEPKAAQTHAAPFITVSRQPGISTDTFTRHLAERLNAISFGWSIWDRDLVEKVVADHHIDRELVEAMGKAGRTWLEDFIRGLSISAGPPDELAVYRRVSTTIRALAQTGKAIIIGRGGVHITTDMPGGVHVRIVAPWGYRVWRLAGELGISREVAAKRIEELEHEREVFYRHYWQHQPPSPEVFSITLNATAGTEEQLAECVLPLAQSATGHLCKAACEYSNA